MSTSMLCIKCGSTPDYQCRITPATTPDDNTVEVVQRSLGRRGLLPSEHLVDKVHPHAEVLVRSHFERGVTIVGPMVQDPSRQTRESAGFAKSAFAVN